MRYSKKELVSKLEISAQDILNTFDDYDKLISIAKELKPAAVAVMPFVTGYFSKALSGSGVAVDVALGAPAGTDLPSRKVKGIVKLIEDGADEIDACVNLQMLASDMEKEILDDLKGVVAACEGKTLRIMVETNLISEEQIAAAARLAKKAGAQRVCNGSIVFGEPTVEKTAVLVKNAEGLLLKANNVRSAQAAEAALELGAERISVPLDALDDVLAAFE